MTTDAAVATRAPTTVDEAPVTPLESSAVAVAVAVDAAESQQSLPSTEAPASPADPARSFRSDASNARPASASSVVPSSLTPPPSSQVPSNNGPSRAAAAAAAAASSQRRMLSPPVPALHALRPDVTPSAMYTAPRPEQVVAASPDELRAMLQACIAEQSRLKMETAHHKLQYQLLSVRADEDARRAAVEQDMILRQLDALRRQKPEAARPLKRALSAGPDMTQAMLDGVREAGQKALKDNAQLRKDYDEACKRLKAAKKLIVRQEEETDSLREENEMLRNRLLDKRELWEKLASPGGMFHTPKTTQPSPVQLRQTPRQTPKHRVDRRARQEPFDVLLQAATQENSSAPCTPMTPNRSGHHHHHHHVLKHSRGVQSLSSLPSTPNNNNARARGSDLLPPPDLVPHTEPPRRFGSRSLAPERASSHVRPERERERERERAQQPGRHSRESTISADDNSEELVRAALLQSVAQRATQQATQQATSFATRGSPPPRTAARVPLPSHRSSRGGDGEVYESQASQEASAMLRRDPRESFEVASSHPNSRDATPTPMAADKRLQSTLRGPVHKPGLSHPVKRKLDVSEQREEAVGEAMREAMSPTKRLRMAGGLRGEGSAAIGLGIRD